MRRRRSLRGINPSGGSCTITNASGVNATAGSVVQMSDIRACAKACGSHWFEPGAMRFFKSRLARSGYADGRGGAFFVTTEKGPSGERRASVRHYSSCSIDTIGKFQGYSTAASATTEAKRLARRFEMGLNGRRRRRR